MPALHDSFTLARTYPHDRARLYAALAEPELKKRWYVDHKMRTQAFEMDFRVGGQERQSYALGDETPFPGAVIENDGRYEDIVEGERIVLSTTMTFGGRRISSSLITFEIAEDGAGSKLTLTHQAAFYEGADGPEMRRAGWTQMLDALARSLAS